MKSTNKKVELLKNRVEILGYQIKKKEIEIERCKRELKKLSGLKI